MKNKNLYLALLITLVLTCSVFAQQQDPIDRGIENYLAALNSKNDGLIESAIMNLMKLKTLHPSRDYAKIMSTLDELTQQTSNKTIRYEAFILLHYLQYPEHFNWIQSSEDQPLDELLATLVVRIHQQTE